jgi:cell wall-associated NlpC family hydrolase
MVGAQSRLWWAMKIRTVTKAVLPFLKKRYSLGCHNEGMDCLGLLWGTFDNLGIELPREYEGFSSANYADKWASGEGKKELIGYLESLGYEVLINYLIPGDIVIYPSGFGIFVGNGRMITVVENHGVMVMPIKALIERAIRVVI